MKKLYNKALIYHNIYSCKWTVLATVLFFSLICFITSNESIRTVKLNICNLSTNKMIIDYTTVVFFMFLFLGIIYVSMKGFKKNSTIEFLMTGPFNKNVILINEIICLCIALSIFLFIYIYFYICQYFRNSELLKLVTNFNELFLWNLFRLLLFGLIFILYLKLLDLLFTNITLVVISMIFIPLMIAINLLIYGGLFVELFSIGSKSYEWLYITFDKSIMFLLDNYYFNDKYSILPIFLWIILGIILGMSIYFTNKKYSINNMNKFFSFKQIESFTVWLSCNTIIVFIIPLILSWMLKFNSTDLSSDYTIIQAILSMLLFIIVSGGISYKISKVIIKKIHSILL